MISKVGGYIIGALVGALIGALIADLVVPTYEEETEGGEWVPENSTDENGNPIVKTDEKTLSDEPKGVVKVDYSDTEKWRKIHGDINEVAKEFLGEDAAKGEEEKEQIVPDGPHLITFDDYTVPFLNYEKKYLTYYELDEVLLLGSQEEPIEPGEDNSKNFDLIGGKNQLQNLGFGSTDPDALYIRNDKTMCDYELIRVRRSWEEVYNEITKTFPTGPKVQPTPPPAKPKDRKGSGSRRRHSVSEQTRKVTNLDDDDDREKDE